VWAKTNSLVEDRIYVGGYEVWRQTLSGTLEEERQSVHVMDGDQRLAMIETLTIDGGSSVGSPTSRERFELGDHLDSCCVELDDSGALITYEEYHPLGTTSFRAAASSMEVSAKRYRYSGKERDEETGLQYYGARYRAAWLGTWSSPDSSGLDGMNRYSFVRGNPITLRDRGGMAASSTKPEDITLQTDDGRLVISGWSVTDLQLHGKGNVPAMGFESDRQVFEVKDFQSTKFAPKGTSFAWQYAGSYSAFEFKDIEPEPYTIVQGDPEATKINKQKAKEAADAKRDILAAKYDFGVIQSVYGLEAVATYSDNQTARYPIPSRGLMDIGNVGGKLLQAPWKENPIGLDSAKSDRVTQDNPSFSFYKEVSGATGKGKAALREVRIKGDFAVWWVIRNRESGDVSYLYHIYIHVDLTYTWNVGSKSWDVAGETSVVERGAGKGQGEPALGAPRVQNYLKHIPLPPQSPPPPRLNAAP
jgi:RHS repeat-associated protein